MILWGICDSVVIFCVLFGNLLLFLIIVYNVILCNDNFGSVSIRFFLLEKNENLLVYY